MNNWEWKKLGDVCDSINGLWKGKKEPFVKVGVIRNTNFTKDCKLDLDRLEYLEVEQRQYAKRKLQPGDLIIEKSGGSEKQPVGRAILFNERDGEYSFSNFTSVLRIKDQNFLNSNFLHIQLYKLYLDGVTKPMQSATTGIHNLDFDKFKDLDICVPPLAEQKRIVKTLDEKFAKIDKLKTAAETNLKNAREIFNAELNSKLNVENDNLPQGWEIKTLDEFTINLDSKRKPVTKKNRTKGKFPYYGASGIVDYVDDYIYDGTFLLISEDGANLVARTTPIAFIAEGKFWVNNHAHIIKVENDWTLRFLIRYFEQLDLNPYVKGMAQPKLSQESLYSIQIPLPPLSEQKRIVAHLDKLSEKVKRLEENYRRTIADCEELKKSILKQVFEVET